MDVAGTHAPAARGDDFLTGGGEMGALVRAHDWKLSPLGPSSAWPQSLRTAASIMLNSAHPMFLAWGPSLVFIYNDAYAPILGTRHPHALGHPFQAIWSEIWHELTPLIETALSGRATWSEDLHLIMLRNGYPEDTWYTFSYSPIRDESGGVGGLFCACTETTAKVLVQRRLTFQVELAERLRAAISEAEVRRVASALLCERLGADRAGYKEFDPDGEHFEIDDGWRHDGLPPISGRHALSDFGVEVAEAVRAGRALRVDDVASDPLTRNATAALAALQVRAILMVPLMRHGRIVAAVSAHMARPRRWTDDDEALVAAVVDQGWQALERLRGEARLRLLVNELNHRVKNTLATVQSIASHTLRGAISPQDVRADFEARILSLSRAHDVLTRRTWEGADLDEIAAATLEPFAGRGETRVLRQGPEVAVSPREALAISMALHELATNAAKYGALSTADGQVSIAWDLLRGARSRRLRLTWTETGGPPVAPPPRRGFGTRLIERGLARELNGSAHVAFPPEGVVCTVEAVLEPEAG
ncbi:GAF domain-containing protein [Phenylobacterium sp. LH3H17]|uniref:PAS domain-containing sensor histidine kinase n=1 Tax=Phenylobacterium sp. LH3H17 TaxID=2903901 RepID=UPI0020C93A9F|nr:HWE histidine kinase domain-containing protein [Phenylobacterium sp. LH3H17]UTP39642.1 GAF domain-containing protein [Phenylobacterium sp. LH3H17]